MEVTIMEEQLRFMLNQRWCWLNDQKNFNSKWYSRVWSEYLELEKQLREIENSESERKNKIKVAVTTGGLTLLGLGVSAMISTSSLGAQVENTLRGVTGKFMNRLI
jgi:hypothetical protein